MLQTCLIKGFKVTLLLFLPILLSAQESVERESPTLDFVYLKKDDGSKLLTATLTIFRNRIIYPVSGDKISFCLGTDSVTAVVNTNSDGKAYLLIQPGANLPLDKEGFTRCQVKYEGNDTLEPAESSLSVRDAVLKMKLDIIDSIKTVSLWAFRKGTGHDNIPLAGEPVHVYVSRMLSLLKIGEGTFDDQGSFTLEFPADLPGDAEGNVLVIARIEENEQFANIETSSNHNWGVPSMHGYSGSHRALWTPIAPMWMIVTLTVLLLGVWGHYIYVIIQLILIKRESKKLKF